MDTTDVDDIPIQAVAYPDDYVVLEFKYVGDNQLSNLVSVDFDEAAKAWRENKCKQKRKYWRYGCFHIKTNGKLCKRALLRPSSKYCKYHFIVHDKAKLETSQINFL